MWNIREKLPFWSHKVRGDEYPSSLTFVDGGVVVGRRNGTVFQLLPVMGRNVLSTVTFINSTQDDPEMFGHVNYDSRSQTLWVANNRRDSIIALKINFDPSPAPGGEEGARGAFFEQIVEFGGPRSMIHFTMLTADADPTGEEARAACVAAKLPPGDLALVAFSVHSAGVDQVIIRKEWFDNALASTPARFPGLAGQQTPIAVENRPQPQRQQTIPTGPSQVVAPAQVAPAPAPPRMKTPPSEEVEGEGSRDEGRGQESRGRNTKGRIVNWKGDNNGSGEGKDAKARAGETSTPTLPDSHLGQTLAKEIKRSEESLHTRLSRLITKELEKQSEYQLTCIL